MGKSNEQLANAGIMLAGEGLHPTSKGKRVRFSGSERTVIDGPFAETKELDRRLLDLSKVKSMNEAIEWLKKAPFDGGTEIEIRPIFEAEDFGAEFTPELRRQDDAIREKIEGKKVRLRGRRTPGDTGRARPAPPGLPGSSSTAMKTSSGTSYLAAQPEARRRNEAESGIEGGMANDDNRPGARLPAGGQPGAHQAGPDPLALAIRPHGHRRQSEDSLIGETVERHWRKKDVAGDRIVVVGDE